MVEHQEMSWAWTVLTEAAGWGRKQDHQVWLPLGCMAETVTELALKLSLEPYPSCTVGTGALWNRLLFADQRWPGGRQHDEVSQITLTLAEVRRGKALKAEEVPKG